MSACPRRQAQGYVIGEDGAPLLPEGVTSKIEVPSELVPYCPKCGKPMSMNLRCDNTFAEDAGWYAANRRYDDFLRRHSGEHILFLELGVGMNTPVIIKYPFWRMTAQNLSAVYACLNYGEALAPGEIKDRSICINGDILTVLQDMAP